MLNWWEVLSPLLGVRKNSGFDQQAVECILCVLYCINTSELCYKCEQTQSTPFRPVKISRTSHTASYLWVMICPAELCLTLRQVLLEDSMFRFFCLELRGQRNWIRLREDPCGCLNHEITHLTVRNSRHFGLLVGRWMVSWSWGINIYLNHCNLMPGVNSVVEEGLTGAFQHVKGRMRIQRNSGSKCRFLSVRITVQQLSE